MNAKKLNRTHRVRSRIKDRSDLPRLVVKRSNQHLHTQIIDKSGKVLAAASSINLTPAPTPEAARTRDSSGVSLTKTNIARQVGVELAALAAKKKIKAVVLDRGHYRFHGRIKALVESLNSNGVKI